MTSLVVRRGFAALGLSAALLAVLATPSFAEIVKLKADLKASSEVPPTKSNGTGAVAITYDTASKKLSWKGRYQGLTGPATAAHFHVGDVGKNGGVAIPIAPNASPFEGSATLSDTQASELMAGRIYVNIHTEANKAGEIRGQVVR